MESALAAVKRFGVSSKRAHLDSSSFCVGGEYLHSQPETEAGEKGTLAQGSEDKDSAKAEAFDSEEPVPIEITHGYSRDHRADLKQYTLALLTSSCVPMIGLCQRTRISTRVSEAFAFSKTPYFLPLGSKSS